MTGLESGNDGVGKREWRGWKAGMAGLESGNGGRIREWRRGSRLFLPNANVPSRSNLRRKGENQNPPKPVKRDGICRSFLISHFSLKTPRAVVCYSCCDMQKILIAILPVFLAVALIALPAFGPFLDHHFAERQPYHAHLGAGGGGGHTHEYAREHSHARADSPRSETARGADGDEAMPNPEIASSAMAAVRAEPGAMTPITPAADSALAVARGGDSIPKSIYPIPPLRPPRADMAASVFPLYL